MRGERCRSHFRLRRHTSDRLGPSPGHGCGLPGSVVPPTCKRDKQPRHSSPTNPSTPVADLAGQEFTYLAAGRCFGMDDMARQCHQASKRFLSRNVWRSYWIASPEFPRFIVATSRPTVRMLISTPAGDTFYSAGSRGSKSLIEKYPKVASIRQFCRRRVHETDRIVARSACRFCVILCCWCPVEYVFPSDQI